MDVTSALLEKAHRSLIAAQRMLEAGSSDFAASRAHYGYFYVAEALLHTEGVRFENHRGLIEDYGQRFGGDGRLDPRFNRLLAASFRLQQIADGDFELGEAVDLNPPLTDQQEVTSLIEEGYQFVEAARRYLTPPA